MSLSCRRLNITPPPSPVFGEKFTSKRPNKRPRTEDLQATTTSTTTAATGNIQIIEADSQGKFVRLFNSGTKVGWQYCQLNMMSASHMLSRVLFLFGHGASPLLLMLSSEIT